MKVVCSWCKIDMGEKEPIENNEISHGMCKECRENMQIDIDRYYFKEWYEEPKKEAESL